jgi:DNA-directed RNA polymerase specialized sigma24 family protein
MPRFKRNFPFIRDEVEIVQSAEAAGRRVKKRELLVGPLAKLHGYTWTALDSVGRSLQRTGSMQLRIRRKESSTGSDVVSRLRSWHDTVEDAERAIQMRECLERLTSEEAFVWERKSRGFSSQDIARFRGCSVNAVDKMFSRIRQKLRLELGEKE